MTPAKQFDLEPTIVEIESKTVRTFTVSEADTGAHARAALEEYIPVGEPHPSKQGYHAAEYSLLAQPEPNRWTVVVEYAHATS